MHNIKYIRDNFVIFEKKMNERNIKIDINENKTLDIKNRELIKKRGLGATKKKYIKNQR